MIKPGDAARRAEEEKREQPARAYTRISGGTAAKRSEKETRRGKSAQTVISISSGGRLSRSAEIVIAAPREAVTKPDRLVAAAAGAATKESSLDTGEACAPHVQKRTEAAQAVKRLSLRRLFASWTRRGK